MKQPAPGPIAAITAGVLVLSLPALLAPQVGASMVDLVREIDYDNAYLSLTRPALLYLLMPLSVAGAFALLSAPGLLLALLLGRGRDIWSWVVEGFVLGLVAISAITAVVQELLGSSLVGTGFFLVPFVLTVILSGLLYRRASSNPIEHPLSTSSSSSRRTLLALWLVPVALVVVLTPKVFWESFNGDGAHAFWTTEMLLHHSFPFFPLRAGTISDWPGISGITYPFLPSWFMRLFGESEAAVRLPFFLLLPVTMASIVGLIEAGAERKMSASSLWLLAGSILSFALILTFSATYNPYMADPSMPGLMDLLVVIFTFSAFAAYENQQYGWLIVLLVLALMTSPAALTMIGFLLAAQFVVGRPLPWRRTAALGVGLVGCLAFLGLLPLVFGLFGIEVPEGEHSPLSLLGERYKLISVTDFERFGYVALAAGVYPVLGLAMWRRADEFTRALILVTLGQFGMHYVMGAAALHYFVPAMLLPLVVFWRIQDDRGWGAAPRVACAIGVLFSVGISLPTSPAIHMATREVGEQIAVTGFEEDLPAALSASTRFRSLFSALADADVPEREYGGSPVAWLYYAINTRPAAAPTTYALVSAGTPVPRGGILVDSDAAAALYVLDEAAWEDHRRLLPRKSVGRRVFALPLDMILGPRAITRPNVHGFGSIIDWITGKS